MSRVGALVLGVALLCGLTAASQQPDDKAIPGYAEMSFEQRRFAQDQRAAQRRTGR